MTSYRGAECVLIYHFLPGEDLVPEQKDETEAGSTGLLCPSGDTAHVPAPRGSLPRGHRPTSAARPCSSPGLLCTSRPADGLPAALSTHTTHFY